MTEHFLPDSFDRFLWNGAIRYSSESVSEYVSELARHGLMAELNLLWSALDKYQGDFGEDAHSFFHEMKIPLFGLRSEIEWEPGWTNAQTQWSAALAYIVAVVAGRSDQLRTYHALLAGKHPDYWFPDVGD